MADKLWFGHARGHMQNVPCPLIDSSVTRNRYVERIQFENGGGDGRRSNQYQMQYDFQFSGLAHEVDGIDAFNKYAQGFYGDDLIHLAHPAAFETNLFPAGWATPSLAEKGWGKISTDAVTYSNADGPMYTNLVTNPSMEGVTAGTDSTIRRNLVTNPSFETDTAGWTASGTTNNRNTTEKYIGSASMQIVHTAGSGTYIDATATPNTTYTASAWVKVPAGVTYKLQLVERTSSSQVGFTESVFVANGTWQRVYISKAFGATGVVARVQFACDTVQTVYVDAVMLEASSDMRSYFDGTYAEDPTLIEAWTGTVNNSTSTALVRGVSNRENLVTNPSFEVDAGGWSAIFSTTISRVTTHSYVGTASLQSVTTATNAAMSLNDTTVAGSSTYTFSAWVKGEAGKTIFLALRELTSTGAEIGRTNTSEFVMTGDWQRVSVTRSFGSTGVKASAYLRNGTVAAAHTYYVDAVMLEQSATLNPYFDGSYTDAPGWTTSWAGTANASRSVATAAPVTVRTNLVTNPSMESVTSGAVVMRQNLCTNPSFEVDVTGWTAAGTITRARSTTRAYTGTASMLISPIASANDWYVHFTATGLTPGSIYTGSFWAYITGDGATNSNRGILVYGGTGGGSQEFNYDRTKLNQWQRLSASAVVGPAGTFQVRAYGMTTFDIYVDSCLIERGSTVGDYFDGSTTAAQGWTYAWSGTANASISTAACAATTVRTNLLSNPSFESGLYGWSSYGAGSTISPDTVEKNIGSASMKIVTTGSIANQGASITLASGGASLSHSVSAWVKAPSSVSILLECSNNVNSVPNATLVGNGAWQRVSLFVTSSGTTPLTIKVSTVSAVATTYYVDNVLVEVASTLGDYFDGSFSPAGDFSYAWTGTDNASTSIQRGATVVGWSAPASIQSRAQSYTGSSSLTCSSDALQDNGTQSAYSATASTTYTASAWVKAESGKLFRMRILEYNGATYVAESSSGNITGTGAWQRVSVTRAFGATGTTARIHFENRTAGAHTFYVDALMLEASPIVQDYFDGSVLSADADLTNSWSGTPHASTSLMRGVRVNATAGNNPYAAAIQSTNWKSTGSSSLRIIPVATNPDSFAAIDMPVASTMAGKTYTILAKIRLAAPLTGTLDGRALKFVGQVNLSGGGTEVVFAGVGVNNVAGVQEYRATFTIPATATTWAFARLYNGASAGNGDVWWDDLLIVQGSYTGDYFDGNSTDSGNTTYNWTGAANASTSTSLSEMVLYGNPPRATTYTVTNINQPPTKVCTLVIPPEYTLYLGASGTSTGSAGVFIRPIQASDSLYYGPTEELTLLDPNGSVRMNKTLNGATYQAVEVFLMKTDANVGTVTLNSMMAQLYKTGTTPQLPSEHYQGEGSTGLMFADDAIVETYSYMHPPRKGIATTLIEVEAWR